MPGALGVESQMAVTLSVRVESQMAVTLSEVQRTKPGSSEKAASIINH